MSISDKKPQQEASNNTIAIPAVGTVAGSYAVWRGEFAHTFYSREKIPNGTRLYTHPRGPSARYWNTVLSSFTEDDWAMVFAVDPTLKDRLHQMLATANEA